MNSSQLKARAKFEWNTFWHVLIVLGIDFLVLVIVSLAIWAFVKFLLLNGQTVLVDGGDVVAAIDKVAWPSACFVLLMLFRNPMMRILNEIPSFIKRSRFDNSKSPLDERDFVCLPRETACFKGEIKHEQGCHAHVEVEQKVCGRLEIEYGVSVHREDMIRGCTTRLDAAFVFHGILYVVEVERFSRLEDLRKVRDQFREVSGEVEQTRNADVVLMLCLVVSDYKKDLPNLRENVRAMLPEDCILKIFNENEL